MLSTPPLLQGAGARSRGHIHASPNPIIPSRRNIHGKHVHPRKKQLSAPSAPTMPPARTQLAQVGTTEGHRALLLLSRIKVLSHLLFQAALFLPGRPGSMEKGFFLLFAGSPPSLNPRCEGSAPYCTLAVATGEEMRNLSPLARAGERNIEREREKGKE